MCAASATAGGSAPIEGSSQNVLRTRTATRNSSGLDGDCLENACRSDMSSFGLNKRLFDKKSRIRLIGALIHVLAHQGWRLPDLLTIQRGGELDAVEAGKGVVPGITRLGGPYLQEQ